MDMVYSYPVVNEAITGGSSQISGDFEIDEAKDLANVLKAGQLPVPARNRRRGNSRTNSRRADNINVVV